MPPMRRYSEAPQDISKPIGDTIGRSDMTRLDQRTGDAPHPQLTHNPNHLAISNYISATDELDLDPINALLRAGEIVNRTSREGQF